MNEIALDGTNLTTAQVAAVANRRATVALSADPAVRRKITESFELNRRLVAEGRPVYGTTTGVGLSVDRQIGSDRAVALQNNLMQLLGCGVGELLPVEIARAALVARANCLARGLSAVRIELIERLIELLHHDVVPCIPAMGSVGASGDLVPGSYVAAVILGERQVFFRGQVVDTATAYAEVGLEPLQLAPKEGLALVNGTNLMTGIAALVIEDAEQLATVADGCTALATEALRAIAGPFEPFLHATAKPHPGQVRSAERIQRLLVGSRLARGYDETLESVGTLQEGSRELPVRLQDHYSIRCAPQCIGALYDALDWARTTVTIELNSSNDNPLFDTAAETVHSGGNFSGFHVGLVMDTIKIAVASVADLLERQFALLNDDKFNNGLGVCCRHPYPEDHPEAGIHHGFKGVQLAISSVTAEALNAAGPMSLFSRSTACHNQDKVSMGTIAARQGAEIVELAQTVAAMHLLILAQAADLRGADRLAAATRPIYDAVRSVSSYLEVDRPLDGDIHRMVEQIRDGSLPDLIEQTAQIE